MLVRRNVIMLDLQTVQLSANAFKVNAFDFYRELRQTAPIAPYRLPNGQPVMLVTRYDDVMMLLRDDKRFVKDRENAGLKGAPRWLPRLLRDMQRNMLLVDGEDHWRLRNLVHKAFTPRMVEKLRGRVEALSHELIDRALARGRFDLIEDYAFPIPMTVMSELLGVPDNEREKFRRLSEVIVAVDSTNFDARVMWTMIRFWRYLSALYDERRLRPQDDLLTALVQAEETGDKLSAGELIAMGLLLVVAGHETTVNLIANGMLALLEHPDQHERLRAEPALIKPGVEELLRYYGPVEIATDRFAAEDTELGGVPIARGTSLLPVLASANRDEDQFADPDRLDLARDPNPHVAFAQGVHYCVGAPLARLEGQVALEALVERLPNLRLTVERQALRWRKSLFLRGLESLPVQSG
jgi:cytochrome P450 PksS